MNKNGFVEKIEVDRLKVSLNNLRSEYENIKNLNILVYAITKVSDELSFGSASGSGR